MRLPHPGELFEGKYQLDRLLGEGGFACVYGARDMTVGRDVAVKILTPRQGEYPERVRKRFVREAQVISELRGPHTITMFEFGTSATGLLYMVFEYVDGVDLQTFVRRHGPVTPQVAAHILSQMLGALTEAHTLGVLHRDIKPANVLLFAHVDDPHRVKLIDFGIAKIFTPEGRPDLTKLTTDGAVVGTLRYLAPEQFYGEELTFAADLYSAGLVTLELLLGTPAIVGDSRDEILRNQLSPHPIALPPLDHAPGLRDALQAMTARKPEHRPASARAALRLLEGASQSGSTSGVSTRKRSAPVSMPAPPRARVPVAPLAVATLAAVAAIALVVGTSEDSGPPIPAPMRTQPASIIRGQTTAPEPATPSEATEPARIADGCASPTTGLWVGEVFQGLAAKPFTAYVPDRPDLERMPTVFVVHRLFGGREFIAETRFGELAEEYGFIVLAAHWEGDPDIDQMASFYLEAYEEVKAQACVDESRLFGLGHAGGGRHLRALRCRMTFSAMAATSDGQLTDERNCEATPTPFLHIWGRDDPHLPRDGSTSCMGKNYLTPEELEDEWRRLNKCSRGSTAWPSAPTGVCRLLDCEAAHVSCLVKGGFDWPHAPEPIEFPGCESPPMDFPVGRTIWKFFDEYGRTI